jgi:hypothetical protein
VNTNDPLWGDVWNKEGNGLEEAQSCWYHILDNEAFFIESGIIILTSKRQIQTNVDKCGQPVPNPL